MFLFKVTSTTRKSICNYLILGYGNELCRKFSKEVYAYPRTFYPFYINKAEIHVKGNIDEETKINYLQQKFKTGDNEVLNASDLTGTYINIYPEPVGNLISIYRHVKQEFDNKNYIDFKVVKNTEDLRPRFKCIIEILWPKKLYFVHEGASKAEAKKCAATKCLRWLLVNKHIKGLKPLMHERDTIKAFLENPIEINFDPEFKNEMETLIDTFDNEIKSVLNASSSIVYCDRNTVAKEKLHSFLFKKLSPTMRMERNATLLCGIRDRRNETNNLPVVNYKKEILDSLENNQILLIRGGTGCGKSTQIPQFIIDSFIEKNKVEECNILMTEPRRISAVSLAERVAYERNEMLGDVVGYQIRFSHELPKMPGSILFCTTGILLRIFQSNPTLKGISHIIIDEAHERTLEIDAILNLLKKILNNSSLKIIIMSATLKTELFQEYFSCKVIDVIGKTYPVKQHFMEDIDFFKMESNTYDFDKAPISYENIAKFIQWIVTNKPPGGILCFLPGWRDIKSLQHLLENERNPNYHIVLLHSKLSNEEQQNAFQPVHQNVRKIILATDIAETSITIEDVTYVIDTALKNLIEWDERTCIYKLSKKWISQANICQRSGRAGRTRYGESYHLITRKMYNRLNLYPKPQIYTISLEQAVIFSKLYCNEKVHDFFSSMLEQPNEETISFAIKYLTDLDILDENENLTALGKCVVNFSLEPALSKALVFSYIFHCFDSILLIAIMYSRNNEIMTPLLLAKSVIRNQKCEFHQTSDHVAAFKWFKLHKTSNINSDISKINKIYKLHLNELLNSGMLQTISDCETLNIHNKNNELIRAVLFSATNKLIKQSDYGYKKNFFTKFSNKLLNEDNKNVVIGSNSVNHKRKVWPSKFATYINSMSYGNHSTSVISDTSIISPLSVLLFSQGDISCQKVKEDTFNEDVVINIHKLKNIQFCCNKETAELLLKFRNILWSIVNYVIQYQGITDAEENLKLVQSYKLKLLDLLTKMLTKSSEHIDNSNK